MAKLSKFLSLTLGAHAALAGTLRCTAFTLKDGSVCLFSPVAGLSDSAQDSLTSIGPVSYLFAPNHYHNKGLAEFHTAFPSAALCASEAARARLSKQTGLVFETLAGLQKQLPAHLSLLEPDGLKTGEVWVVATARRVKTWFVVDAFGAGKIPKDGGAIAELSSLKTFPTYGIADNAIYNDWVRARLAADKPRTIVPCHGAIMSRQAGFTAADVP